MATGFASHAGESDNPGFWQGLRVAYAPGLGSMYSGGLIDFSGRGNHITDLHATYSIVNQVGFIGLQHDATTSNRSYTTINNGFLQKPETWTIALTTYADFTGMSLALSLCEITGTFAPWAVRVNTISPPTINMVCRDGTTGTTIVNAISGNFRQGEIATAIVSFDLTNSVARSYFTNGQDRQVDTDIGNGVSTAGFFGFRSRNLSNTLLGYQEWDRALTDSECWQLVNDPAAPYRLSPLIVPIVGVPGAVTTTATTAAEPQALAATATFDPPIGDFIASALTAQEVQALAATATFGTGTAAVHARTDGFSANVTLSGFGDTIPNTYDTGLETEATRKDPTTNGKMVVTVTSTGFDAAGNATTHQRIVYGTKVMRKPFPNQAELDETDVAGDAVVRVALSEPIYPGETATATVAAGFGNDGSFDSAEITSTPITNVSTHPYPKPIARSVWFNHENVKASSYLLEWIVATQHPLNGRPFACIKISAQDEAMNTPVTATVTDWTVASRAGLDGKTMVTSEHLLDLSTLNAREQITVTWEVFPWIGDATLSSAADEFDHANPEHCYFFNNKNSDYPTGAAYVDFTSGNDGTGVVVDANASHAAAVSTPYKTIWNATEGIRLHNAGQGHDDLNGAECYLKADTAHQWTADSTIAVLPSDGPDRTNTKCELLVTRDPAATRAQVAIHKGSSFGGNQNRIRTTHTRVHGVTLADDQTGAGTLFLGESPSISESITMHDVDIDEASVNAQQITSYTLVNYVHSLATAFTRPLTESSATLKLRRGLDGTTFEGSNSCYTTAGCHLIGSATVQFGIRNVNNQNAMVWMNRIEDYAGGTSISMVSTTGVTGYAVVGNVFESTTVGVNAQIGAETSTSTIENFVIDYNTFVGQGNGGRLNFAYQEDKNQLYSGAYRFNSTVISDVKNDIFYSDGARVGNWWVTYGCNHCGNVNGGAAVNLREYTGLYGKNSDDSAVVFDFANDLTGSTGGGDYQPGASSDLLARATSALEYLPIDLEAGPRNLTAGARAAESSDVTGTAATAQEVQALAATVTFLAAPFTADAATAQLSQVITASVTFAPNADITSTAATAALSQVITASATFVGLTPPTVIDTDDVVTVNTKLMSTVQVQIGGCTMATEVVHVGDVGTKIRKTIMEDGVPVSLSNLATIEIKINSPGGISSFVTPVVIGAVEDGTVEADSDIATWQVSGRHREQVQWTTTDGDEWSAMIELRDVEEKLP